METVIRVAAIYLFVLVGLRIIGKRELSQLTPIDLIVLLLIPELASQAMLGEDFSIVNAFIGIATLFSLVFLVSVVKLVSTRVDRFVEGSPSILVEHGTFVANNLNRERVTPGEVFAEMHLAQLERLEQVKWAILESDGKISIIPESGS